MKNPHYRGDRLVKRSNDLQPICLSRQEHADGISGRAMREHAMKAAEHRYSPQRPPQSEGGGVWDESKVSRDLAGRFAPK